MPKFEKEVTIEQFINACNHRELKEVERLIHYRRRYQNKMKQMEEEPKPQEDYKSMITGIFIPKFTIPGEKEFIYNDLLSEEDRLNEPDPPTDKQPNQFLDNYGNPVHHGSKIIIEKNYNYDHWNNREAIVGWYAEKGMYRFYFPDQKDNYPRFDFYGIHSFKVIQ